jgi:hypothetical protein
MVAEATVFMTVYCPECGWAADGCAVAPFGNGIYRLEEAIPFCECCTICDVIEADQVDHDTLEFVRVVEKGHWVEHCFIVPRKLVDSPALDKALARIEAKGGRWQRLFVGMLFVYVPPESDCDPDAEMSHLIDGQQGPESER